MTLLETFTFSPRYTASSSKLPFGLAVVSGTDFSLAKEVMADHKRRALERIETEADLISNRIGMFDAFFRRFGSKCPLPYQFARVQETKDFPGGSPYIDALLTTELTHGVLMGVQDRDHVVGALTYDLSEKGEQFVGMRGTVHCRKDEMVVRDAEGIVASYLQGPDKRTAITNSTKNLVFYAFAAPGIEPVVLNDALTYACLTFDGVAESSEHRVYTA